MTDSTIIQDDEVSKIEEDKNKENTPVKDKLPK